MFSFSLTINHSGQLMEKSDSIQYSPKSCHTIGLAYSGDRSHCDCSSCLRHASFWLSIPQTPVTTTAIFLNTACGAHRNYISTTYSDAYHSTDATSYPLLPDNNQHSDSKPDLSLVANKHSTELPDIIDLSDNDEDSKYYEAIQENTNYVATTATVVDPAPIRDEMTMLEAISLFDDSVLKSTSLATEFDDWDQWQDAIQMEFKAHQLNDLADIVPVSAIPQGTKGIHSKYVFVQKFNETGKPICYKIRMFAIGDEQLEVYMILPEGCSKLRSNNYI
ncbi:hypothetical protein SARC_00326 [Sphaeroforma arctica JP610]|uniref:Uncharacterized protein n=1 Tax=Sphaeroforma arctica JP610 TaxID=667725 RepID=A0A0L0GFF0_9EUKA|nr:hypothetical protein SARC_00326 [Sphaeroforma arctica JP610]KNC87561.1 hypothetical protein SARC_00326 [Sphaeroforma arctica JP610]|eukprot:XP_014161463.1 hypothetical protein SARC_00326 [Sphaeroforma arctica JP610]